MNIRHTSDAENLAADIRVPGDSPWFRGHFPGHPVLPGIAQLGMVLDLIRDKAGQALRIHEISRVRFKQMIVPEDRLVVEASLRPGRPGVYAFRILKADELITSGVMAVADAEDDGKTQP